MLLNHERMFQKMTHYGVDALIASNCENITYCASFETNSTYRYKYGRVRAYCVLLKSDILNPVLITPVDLLAHLAIAPSWVRDIRSYGNYYVFGKDISRLNDAAAQFLHYMSDYPHYLSAEDALVQVLKEKGLTDAQIGFDETNLLPDTWEVITIAFPHATFTKANQIFKEIRMIKTQPEIQLIKESTRINDQATRELIKTVRQGVSEIELYQCYRHHLVKNNAYFGFYTTGCGPRSGAVYSVPPSNVTLSMGDSIRYDAGCVYKGYWSDTARTIFLGEPTKDKQNHFNAIYKGVLAAEAMLKPGIKVSELFTTAVKTVRESGIPDYNRHHVGHSMGLETYEAPMIISSDRPCDSDGYLSEDGEMRLEENMVLNIECPYYHLEIGGVQFEETYLITQSGYIRLSSLARGPYIIT